MNEIIKAMKTRRSIRGYKEDMVPEELIAEVVEAGTYAATGMGRQSPVVLVVLADKSRPTYLYDGSLVMGNLMLAAHSLGLGSCWIHRAKETFEREEGKAILKELGIEGDYEGIGNCVIGYAKEPAKDAAPRKTDYVHYIK